MTFILVSLISMSVGVLLGARFERSVWQLANRKLLLDAKQERARAVLKAFQRGLTTGRVARTPKE